MRLPGKLLATWLAVGYANNPAMAESHGLQRKQNSNFNSNDLPTLGGSSTSIASSTSAFSSNPSTSQATTLSLSATTIVSGTISSSDASPSPSSTSLAGATTTSATVVPTSTVAPTHQANQTSIAEGLPLTPHITPALSIGGVILILTGLVYALVGVKNKWVHVSLSTAYLTSLSVCVLIVYVMNPPVSNAIQGAYLVGIFMTGLIFGAGALIFKEVTEGLGCLLGGFCLAMWFLTLKSGGLVTSTTGKAILISIFCGLAWSLSFSHITRPYALIGSTSFAGATAFMLGIDCFSRGGLKEFWLYIWNLNPDLFPVDTTTYPIVRGTRVETIVIVLGCIIGIISQIKLWKVVKDRQEMRVAAKEDDARRQDAVEVALGRHLERRNDRDKSEWEKQYGNLLQAKRETILWADVHREKKTYSRILDAEHADRPLSASVDSLEMNSMPQRPRSVYVARVKRQSNMAVDTITEVEETEQKGDTAQDAAMIEGEGSRDLNTLNRHSRTLPYSSVHSARHMPSRESLSNHRSSRDEPQQYHESSFLNNAQKPLSDLRNSLPPSTVPLSRTLQVGARESFRIPGSDSDSTQRSSVQRDSLLPRPHDSSPNPNADQVEGTSDIVSQSRSRSHSPDHRPTSLVRSSHSLNPQLLTAPEKDASKRRSWTSMFSRSSAKDDDAARDNDMSKASVSQEALVVSHDMSAHSRASSVAATLDSENEILDPMIHTDASDIVQKPAIIISPAYGPDSAAIRTYRNSAYDAPVLPVLEEDADLDPEELVRPVAKVMGGPRQSSSAHGSSNQRGGADSEVGTEMVSDEGPSSHAATTNTSLSEVLTKGALEKVPSQLSNVVLSYRTNEWAKHASSAEAPIYEEPEILGEDFDEAPAHLVAPEEVQKMVAIVAPPPLSRPATAISRNSFHEAAISSPVDGMKVNPAVQSARPGTSPKPVPSVQPQTDMPRTRAHSDVARSNSATRGLRSSSTPMLVSSLATAPIDENAAVNFTPNPLLRNTSVTSFRRVSGDGSPAHHYAASPPVGTGVQPYGDVYAYHGSASRSMSRLSLVSETGGASPRPVTQQGPKKPVKDRLDTRMASYDSHQPLRRNTDLESQRREALFADWRMSQQRSVTPSDQSEARHAQRVFEKMQAKQTEAYQKSLKAQQELQIDAVMRGRDMQEAYREALRRMQANANKKITK